MNDRPPGDSPEQSGGVGRPERLGRLTDDRSDPRLGHGVGGSGMNEAYLVLPEEERAKGYVRPLRASYVHAPELGGCGTVTTMAHALAETYARQPGFYGATYCAGCRTHLPVGGHGVFYWQGTTERVGT